MNFASRRYTDLAGGGGHHHHGGGGRGGFPYPWPGYYDSGPSVLILEEDDEETLKRKLAAKQAAKKAKPVAGLGDLGAVSCPSVCPIAAGVVTYLITKKPLFAAAAGIGAWYLTK